MSITTAPDFSPCPAITVNVPRLRADLADLAFDGLMEWPGPSAYPTPGLIVRVLRLLATEYASHDLFRVHGLPAVVHADSSMSFWADEQVDTKGRSSALTVSFTVSWPDSKGGLAAVAVSHRFHTPIHPALLGDSTDSLDQAVTFIRTAIAHLSARLASDSAAWRTLHGTDVPDSSGLHHSPMYLVYVDARGRHHDQPYGEIVSSGSLIDPETGEDMEIVGWSTPLT